MKIEEMGLKARRDLNNAICLIGIIPILTLVYMLTVKVASLSSTFSGEAGYIMLVVTAIMLTGIITGKRLLFALMQELLEKEKLATISETVLTLSHEINNPLMIMQGNLELLNGDLTQQSITDTLVNRVGLIKSNCERISQVTQKLMHLSKPISVSAFQGRKIIDLNKSQ